MTLSTTLSARLLPPSLPDTPAGLALRTMLEQSEPLPARELLAPIAEDLRRVEAKMKTVEGSIFAPLADAFVDLIGHGGKRLRPAVALLAAHLHGPIASPEHYRRLVALAAAVEMLHTSTLVHDDVIDGALLRRGAPTLNARWSQGATVLAGDYMFARAAHFAAETGHMRVIHIFSDTLQVIVDGELAQLSDRNVYDQEKEGYYRRIYAKTASLFQAATEAAAVLADFPEEQIRRLRDYGYYLGMAFQIVDDILDFTGDEASLGKPAGSDLRQGTLTLPFFYYLRRHPHPQQVIDRLQEANHLAQDGHPEALHQAVAQVVQEIRTSPAIQDARQEALGFLEQAAATLAPFPDSPYRRSLLHLCAFVLQRQS